MENERKESNHQGRCIWCGATTKKSNYTDKWGCRTPNCEGLGSNFIED